MSFEAKVKEMGYTVETLELDAGKIMLGVRSGNLIYTSGQVSAYGDKTIKGKVGADLTVEQGYEAAQLCTLNCLSVIKTLAGGRLDNVKQIVKVFGMVNVAPDFDNTPGVIHGCSDMLLSVFGESGKHARSAIGLVVPLNFAVEIEVIAEVK